MVITYKVILLSDLEYPEVMVLTINDGKRNCYELEFQFAVKCSARMLSCNTFIL